VSPTGRIVVLGGGFGGVFTAVRLERRLRGDPGVEISLVNKENYFVFQPLLPEVAAGSIVPSQVANPLRRMLRTTRFFASEVDEIDLQKKMVSIFVGEGRHLRVLPYDHLVLALGTIVDLSSLPGLSEHSLPLKNIGDAFYLRNHVIGCLEQADIETDLQYRKALCTFVVVGGGFSGVETIGEMQEMVHLVLPHYRNIPVEEVRFVLVHSQERILPEVVPGLASYAQTVLRSRGIETLLKVRCKAATVEGIFLSDGRMVRTRTLVSTVGNAPNPLLRTLPCPKDRGRVVVEPTLAVPGHPGVWALGDCAMVPSPDGTPYAPTAQNAIRQAVTCADNIAATLRGETMKPFVFHGLGKLASLGGRSAVAEILGLRIKGFVAWWLWRTIYLMKLPGWERRLRVALDWTLDLFFERNLVQLKVFRTEKVDRAHYEPGEAIVTQGEIGDRFYVIAQGRVEVVREHEGVATRLATLGPGEHFGEVALMKDLPRNASVKALEPTDVLAIGRGDFAAFAQNLTLLKASLQDSLAKRAAADEPPPRQAAQA
jgi:NADH:ubiquinone reductase (H+-translocating)